MSSRVTPFRASFIGNQEIPASEMRNDVPFNCESQEQENTNERLLKAVQEIYSPLLRAMKSFGIYYGDATFKHFKDTSSSYRRRNVLTIIYGCVVASGFWINFTLASTAMIFNNDIYLVLMMSFWCLFMALNATISLVVLPITGRKKSRLEKYLRFLLAAVKTINLEKVKKNSRTALAVFCLLFIIAAAGILAGALFLNFNIGTFKPWHKWFGFRIFSTTFLVIGVGSWLLPIIFFCNTSLMLETLFDDLHRRMSPSYSTPNMDLTNFKVEYHKLCEVVELADKVLAPLLLVFVSVYIPLLCFSFYNVARPRDEDSQLFFLFNLLWFLFAAAILAVILVFGSKVGEKIYSFQKVLQVFPVSTADESKLLMFMMDIQGDPKGLSIGGLVVINKSMSLTVVGIIVSYFAVMLSLPG